MAEKSMFIQHKAAKKDTFSSNVFQPIEIGL